MGSHHKKKKGTDDTRIVVADIKDDLEQDTIRTALQPSVEIGRDPIIRTMIDFCNVLEGIDSNQTNAPVAPGQTVGLTVTPISGSQLNLAWTASTSPILGYYNVYKGTSTGFIVDGSSLISQPTTNSYSNTGLISGTQYFYRVSATNQYNQTGTISAEANGTTTGSPPPVLPNLWLKFDGGATIDSSGNGNTITVNSINGNTTLGAPGQFGANYYNCNTPTNSPNHVSADYLRVTNNSNVQLDMSVGFSISLWLNPTALAGTQCVYYKCDASASPVDYFSLELKSTGILIFSVWKADTQFKTEVSGIVTASWQHIAATFNGATNIPIIYRNAVAGGTGTAAVPNGQNGSEIDVIIGRHGNTALPGTPWYRGKYDEIQYFKSRVLTPTQVTNLMNTNAP